jgi:hypothetical protein
MSAWSLTLSIGWKAAGVYAIFVEVWLWCSKRQEAAVDEWD